MKVSFLFWNLGKRPLQHRIARLAAAHDIDIFVFAECEIPFFDVLAELNGLGKGMYCRPVSERSKIVIFTRFPESWMVDEFNDPLGGLSIRRLRVDPSPGLLLAAVHAPSRVNWERDDQMLYATALAHDIIQTEEKLGHRRTVLVGDLSMHPFDPGVVGAQALHAMMTRDLARREERDIRGRPYRFFYNPMWGFFGDRTPGPPGTYYLSAAKPVNYWWTMYDQVLLRPTLMDSLRQLEILDNDGQEGLLTRHGLPDASQGSDHLPLFFTLDL